MYRNGIPTCKLLSLPEDSVPPQAIKKTADHTLCWWHLISHQDKIDMYYKYKLSLAIVVITQCQVTFNLPPQASPSFRYHAILKLDYIWDTVTAVN